MTTSDSAPSRTGAPGGYSIIIPTRNRAELLHKALQSIQDMTPPAGVAVEVLVIDNGSTDETSEVAHASVGRFPVRVVREERLGLNHGRNRAIVEANHEFLVYLDDDMEVRPEWLVSAHAALVGHTVEALCGPVDPRFERPPPKWMTQRLIESVTSAYSQKGENIRVLDQSVAHELPGCNFGVWRELALQLGGFHPSLDRSGAGMLAGGDSQFGKRVVQSGGRVLYVPGCRITHLISRQKTSLRGLARRWHGMGQTERAMQVISGSRRRPRETLGRIRFVAASAWIVLVHLLAGKQDSAAERLMAALRVYGHLSFRDSRVMAEALSARWLRDVYTRQ